MYVWACVVVKSRADATSNRRPYFVRAPWPTTAPSALLINILAAAFTTMINSSRIFRSPEYTSFRCNVPLKHIVLDDTSKVINDDHVVSSLFLVTCLKYKNDRPIVAGMESVRHGPARCWNAVGILAPSQRSSRSVFQTVANARLERLSSHIGKQCPRPNGSYALSFVRRSYDTSGNIFRLFIVIVYFAPGWKSAVLERYRMVRRVHATVGPHGH